MTHGHHVLSYVNGDPVNLRDPDGHRACADQQCYAYQFKPGGAIHVQWGGVFAEETAGHRSQYIDQKYNSDLASAREWAREDLDQLHACGRMVGNPCSSEVWQNDSVAGTCDLASCIAGFLANKLDALLTVGTVLIEWVPGAGEAADAGLGAKIASEGSDAIALATDGGASLDPAIIGEGMTRVRGIAQEFGGVTYEATPGLSESELMAENQAQVDAWKAEGRPIWDIGPAPNSVNHPNPEHLQPVLCHGA